MQYTGKLDEGNVSKEGITGAIIFHLFLLLAFWWATMNTTFPPPMEQGFLVSFGNTEKGQGSEQPVPESDQAATEENLVQNTASPQESEKELEESKDVSKPSAAEKGDELENSKNSEAPKLADSKVKNKKEDKKDTKKKPAAAPAKNKANDKTQNIDPNALFKPNKSSNAANSSSSQGDQNNRGDQGSNQGSVNNSPNANNMPSGPPGIGANLTGRVLLDIPKPFDSSREEGIVVIKIKVDKSGKVIEATFQSAGSTTSSSVLKNLAINSAKKAKFNADPKSPDIQTGKIKYTFRNQ